MTTIWKQISDLDKSLQKNLWDNLKKITQNIKKTKEIDFTKMNIYQKINEIKKENISLQRDTKAYNYKYATLDQIQKKLNPIITKVWLVIIHTIEDWYVITKIVNIDKPEETIISKLLMKEWLDAQKKGSEITYYRRYNVLSMLDLEVEDDDWKAASKKDIKKSNSSNNNTNDEKPWYNDFEKHQKVMKERIEKWETPDDIIKKLSENYKINKKVREAIKAL